MISYQLTSDNELIVYGTMELGEKLLSLCCKGHTWEVSCVLPDDNPGYTSVWGTCHNPDCPVEADNCYHGVSRFAQEDIAEYLLDMVDVSNA